jgi:2'-5' RNA ligase
MEGQDRFSLWFVPEGEAYRRYEALIQGLSERQGAPAFSPHVTLLGGVTGEEKEVSSITEVLAMEIPPFEIHFKEIGCLDEYYRCLFLRAEDTEEIMDAYRKAEDAFRVRHTRPFMPHLSLMYGNYDAQLKERIIDEIGDDLPPGFRAGTLSLYRTGGQAEEWGLIEEFQLGKR